ncbi:MAG: ATP-grasp domain-containing protein [Chlamydiota bacterium]
MDELHNKWRFNKKIEALGFDAPKSYLIRSEEELKQLPLSPPYILKPSYSRAALCIRKVTSTSPTLLKIDPKNPLVAQEWLHGKKFCSYSIAHHGKLASHTVYPVDISIEGNACLNFEAITHKNIQSWIASFVEKENFTGQIAFDFIETENRKLYAIECNPRGTSGIHLFQQKDSLPDAFFNTQSSLVYPEIGYSKKLGWGMILYGWKTTHFSKFIKKLITVEDVIFSRNDLKPFFHQPILFFVYLFRSLKIRASLPAMFTFDIDWNGQEAIDLDQIPCKESLVARLE